MALFLTFLFIPLFLVMAGYIFVQFLAVFGFLCWALIRILFSEKHLLRLQKVSWNELKCLLIIEILLLILSFFVCTDFVDGFLVLIGIIIICAECRKLISFSKLYLLVLSVAGILLCMYFVPWNLSLAAKGSFAIVTYSFPAFLLFSATSESKR